MPVGLTFEGLLVCLAFYGVAYAIGYGIELAARRLRRAIALPTTQTFTECDSHRHNTI